VDDTDRTDREAGMRVDETRLRASGCGHADQVTEVEPSADGCEDCLAAGRRDWVHLRVCMTCGHMGCCDASPGKHATAHHKSTGHPIVVSWEQGWAWCYPDEILI
jgi:uncharacterized UBP type Zn finger protein